MCLILREYFEQIVQQLSIEEIAVLGILLDQDATAAFKAIRRQEVMQSSDLSLAQFRKTMEKLTATYLINVVTGGKEHKVYLTSYGTKALEKSLEEVNE